MRILSSDTFWWVSDNFASQIFNHQPPQSSSQQQTHAININLPWPLGDKFASGMNPISSVFSTKKMSILPLLINKGTIKHFRVFRGESWKCGQPWKFLFVSQRVSFQSCNVCRDKPTKQKVQKESWKCILPHYFWQCRAPRSNSGLSCGWGIITCLLIRTGYFYDSPHIPSPQKSKTKKVRFL